ncbi:hypothetical protein L226DRAFT_556694 [Lentinus tigrinus ALCF2SS1-7]|uniref:uncharacterized protein n=1 Tax=Lentinus tigrinus ALCF2SS1-7 TaxID=1328758 RepID=UPI001165C977|nr:hypothetical protein L226DRAFT_556694 [Lentinus tigrinus ALCF2SS1-7]
MADSQLAQIIAIYATGQIGAYFATAATAVFMYEWMLTFDREVDLFWRRKVTVSSILFLVNRYLPFVVILIFAPWQNPPTTGKGYMSPMHAARLFGCELIVNLWLVFSALRAYVLSSKGWPVATLVFLLSLAPVGVNYTYRTSKELKALNQTTSLSSVLFRDGVLYFTTLTILNILHLNFSLLSILDNNVYTSGNSSDISVLNEPVTAILISRFLIDLQEANIQSMHQDSLASVGTLNFDRVVGSASFCLSVPAEVPGISTQEHGSAAQAVEAEPGVEPEIIEVDRSLGEA